MTRLSNRQYPMLQMFASESSGYHMRVEEAQQWDQRPFRSMLIQGWVAYRPGRGFHLTKKGREAWREFGNTDIARHDPTRPLTGFFDATLYGIDWHQQAERAAKLREMPVTISA